MSDCRLNLTYYSVSNSMDSIKAGYVASFDPSSFPSSRASVFVSLYFVSSWYSVSEDARQGAFRVSSCFGPFCTWCVAERYPPHHERHYCPGWVPARVSRPVLLQQHHLLTEYLQSILDQWWPSRPRDYCHEGTTY